VGKDTATPVVPVWHLCDKFARLLSGWLVAHSSGHATEYDADVLDRLARFERQSTTLTRTLTLDSLFYRTNAVYDTEFGPDVCRGSARVQTSLPYQRSISISLHYSLRTATCLFNLFSTGSLIKKTPLPGLQMPCLPAIHLMAPL
jgi:hypothetical protein